LLGLGVGGGAGGGGGGGGGGVFEWGRVVGQCFFCVARVDVDTSATLEQERVAQIYFKIYL